MYIGQCCTPPETGAPGSPNVKPVCSRPQATRAITSEHRILCLYSCSGVACLIAEIWWALFSGESLNFGFNLFGCCFIVVGANRCENHSNPHTMVRLLLYYSRD